MLIGCHFISSLLDGSLSMYHKWQKDKNFICCGIISLRFIFKKEIQY